MKLQPVVAGSFYPRKPGELERSLDSFNQEKAQPLGGETVGLLLPHAGYPYSGAVAALGYRSLPAPVETVVLAGPSHYVPFKGISIFAGESVITPLGEVSVDQETCR